MMNKEQTLEMIAAISNANGAPGFEDEVVKAILPYAGQVGETETDRMRNLFIRRKENKGSRPVVQLDAHSDEVAFMVQAICPNGTLRIIPLGGWISCNGNHHAIEPAAGKDTVSHTDAGQKRFLLLLLLLLGTDRHKIH